MRNLCKQNRTSRFPEKSPIKIAVRYAAIALVFYLYRRLHLHACVRIARHIFLFTTTRKATFSLSSAISCHVSFIYTAHLNFPLRGCGEKNEIRTKPRIENSDIRTFQTFPRVKFIFEFLFEYPRMLQRFFSLGNYKF